MDDFAEKALQETSESSGTPPKEDQSLPPPPPPPPEPEEKAQPSPPKEELPRGDRIFASPVAKKLALERGIPLAKVKGTGPDGRIILADVEKYKPSAEATVATSKTIPQTGQPAEYTDTPLSNMRKVIGERLTKSKQELPHYYVTTDIDMGRTLKLREVFNQSFAKDESKAKLSVNDFVIKAAALALRDVPEVNSAWLGDVIRQLVTSFRSSPDVDYFSLGTTKPTSVLPLPLLQASSPRLSVMLVERDCPPYLLRPKPWRRRLAMGSCNLMSTR